jgi:hypothetical protein
LDYVVHISRGAENVATDAIKADSDIQAFERAKTWAAALNLAPDYEAVLAVRLPSGRLKTFLRKDF